MIEGLDSSLARPGDLQVLAAHAAGVRLWSGYLATKSGVGLLSPWDRASFDVARKLGGKPLGMASGWDDPVALRALAAEWNVRLCLDCEDEIRGLGPWTAGWVEAAASGIYGNANVHAVRAAFHVLADYPGFDPMDTWKRVSSVPQPDGPLAWQWQGTHTEFGLSVDRGWYDDWFLTGGEAMATALTVGDITAMFINMYRMLGGRFPNDVDKGFIREKWVPAYQADPEAAVTDFGNAVAAEHDPPVDVIPVRQFELDAALAGLKPSPPVPGGPPGPFHTHKTPEGQTGGPIGTGP